MPRIFDNLSDDTTFSRALTQTLKTATRADFCVGYFNLRGWSNVADYIEQWQGGEENQCRLLIGMQINHDDELHELYSLSNASGENHVDDNASIKRAEHRVANEFVQQLQIGYPDNTAEANLRRLYHQLKSQKLIVKFHALYKIHAKLYLLFRDDYNNPCTGFMGSSNLTFSGLSRRGELNIDIVDHTQTQELCDWFEERWNERACLDMTEAIINAIENSWARPQPIRPFLIYAKMAYHLSQEARTGILHNNIPPEMEKELLPHQATAVTTAAEKLKTCGGVMIGDVVGLGKTMVATALMRIYDSEPPLIICPKNLVKMWEHYCHKYAVRAPKVISLSDSITKLEGLRRYKIVVIDESHNLRNREGKRYAAVYDYIRNNAEKVILLTATPYNKKFTDLSNQLRLFIEDTDDIGISPERLLSTCDPKEFATKHQCPVSTLRAFEKSEFKEDWQDLMRRYMVRRTRAFILAEYAQKDQNGRSYLMIKDQERFYFPTRQPKTLTYACDFQNPNDQYARIYDDSVVNALNEMPLPRYGLSRYISRKPTVPPTPEESKRLEGLSKSGEQLIGFWRTNLFKRLESCGESFIISAQRHLLRNFIYLHAIQINAPLPIGSTNLIHDTSEENDREEEDLFLNEEFKTERLRTSEELQAEARRVYSTAPEKEKINWIRSGLFTEKLKTDLEKENRILFDILKTCGQWNPKHDSKLRKLIQLITVTHPHDKILIFTQFADTAEYIEKQLKAAGIDRTKAVTGDTADPHSYAKLFSPLSNGEKPENRHDSLRILIATDVLSEGQNLQDAHIIVNFDLPWAIIPLIQRAGRIDRIGQKSSEILCYSFVPAEGVEKILHLRDKLTNRLRENREVIGADDLFFEEEQGKYEQTVRDIYTEKAGSLDGTETADVYEDIDLTSYAHKIWLNMTKQNPQLESEVTSMPNVVLAAKSAATTTEAGTVIVMLQDNNHYTTVTAHRGEQRLSLSQKQAFELAACSPLEQPLPHAQDHHDQVQLAVAGLCKDKTLYEGNLGSKLQPRYRLYSRLRNIKPIYENQDDNPRDLFSEDNLEIIETLIEALYKAPLTEQAQALIRDIYPRVTDFELIHAMHELYRENRFTQPVDSETIQQNIRLICSMGLI